MASLNAGWSISVMAGTLNIQLEKPGRYTIRNNSKLSPKHITKVLCMMLLTAALLTVSIIVPLLALKHDNNINSLTSKRTTIGD